MTTLMPILKPVKRRTKDNDPGLDDGASVEDRTQDGTLDVYGRPASKSKTGGWNGASFVLVAQLLSTTGFYAVSTNLFIYLTTLMHESNSSAAKNVSNWIGTCYLVPLISGFVADSYTGRFLGAFVCDVICLLGLVILTVSGSKSSLRPLQCPTKDLSCEHPTLVQRAFLYVGLYVMVLGSGGLSSTVIPFGADQFDEDDDVEKRQKSSFFNWNYQTFLCGSIVASTLFVYIESNLSSGIGWGIASAAQLTSTIVFVKGMRFYRYQHPGGNPLPRMAQVLVAALRKRGAKTPDADLERSGMIHETKSDSVEGRSRTTHSNNFSFLDKAAIATQADKDGGMLHNPWHVCTMNQVEEVKYLVRVLPIFLTGILYTTCYSQLTTLFVEQGHSMERRLGSFQIPSSSISVFESLSVVFWVVVYDRLLVPLLRKHTGNYRGISELQRIGVGLALSILSMAIAALVEIRRLQVARAHGLLDDTVTPVPMSVFWEVPQFFVMGASEVCTYIGLMEFFYAQAPRSIRSLGTSVALLSNSLGYFLSSVVLTIVNSITRRGGRPGWIADNINRGQVDLFYMLLAVLSTANFMAFLVCAWKYKYVANEGPVTRNFAEGHLLKGHDGHDERSDISAVSPLQSHQPSRKHQGGYENPPNKLENRSFQEHADN